MIRIRSSNQTEIKQETAKFIAENSERYPVTTNYPHSVKNQILDMLSGIGSFLARKYLMSVPETNLSTAKLKDSIYANAEDWGYSISRSSAPTIQLIHTDNEARILNRGDSLGSILYEGEILNLIYFGNTRKFNFLDEIIVHVGKYVTKEGDFLQTDFSKPVSMAFYPETEVESVDNEYVHLTINERAVDYSSDVRDLVLLNIPSVVTKNNFVAGYGIGIDIIYTSNTGRDTIGLKSLQKTDKWRVEYILTKGSIYNIESLVRASNTLPNGVSFDKVLTTGYAEEDVDKVRRLAPAFYSTGGRMVTESDYEVATAKHALIYDSKFVRFDEYNRNAVISYVPSKERALTAYEENLVLRSLDHKRLAGTIPTLSPADIILESMIVVCRYKCDQKNIADTVTSLEEVIKSNILDVFSKYSGKQNVAIPIDDLEYAISQIKVNDILPMRSVYLEKLNTETGESVEYGRGTILNSDKTTAYKFDLRIELSC